MGYTDAQIQKALRTYGVDPAAQKVSVLAVRGADGRDDYGVYDDKQYVVAPSGEIRVVEEANTNPSLNATGRAELLTETLYPFVPGKHPISHPERIHYAFRQPQGVRFRLHRINEGYDTGEFAIDWHRGGINGTSSEGCQTNPPAIFDAIRKWIYSLLGVTEAMVDRDPLGEHLARFNYLILTPRQIDAAQKVSAAIPPLASAPTQAAWSVVLPDGKPFAEVVSAANRPYVPARAFLATLLGIPPETVPIRFVGETLEIFGKPIAEVSDELRPKAGVPARAWCPVREAAEAAGFTLGVAWPVITIQKRKMEVG